ncbi:MAG: hypothetical protein ACOC56_03015 [Atribacterota bacterium]
MSESESDLNSWDGLLKNYLKAEDIPGELGTEATIVCTGASRNQDNLDLNVEYTGKKYIFTLNVTNMAKLKSEGILAPKEVIGKKITVKKSVATNPQTRKEVPTLRISKIE